MGNFQQELVSSVKKYCQDKIVPLIEHDDEKAEFRKEIFHGFGELGLCGIPLPENYGGAGLNYQDYCLVLEEIGRHSVAYAVTLSVSTMVQSIILEFGSDEQKKKYLPKLTSGEVIGSFALSESHSGSDAANLKTTAKKVDGGYLLNGTKMWVTSAGLSETYIVMARTGGEGAKGISAFIVDKGTPGFSFGKAEKKMGWLISPTRELIFENCLIPTTQLLSSEGVGFKIAMAALAKGRFTIASIAVGLAQASLDYAVSYSLERKQFNQAIFDFQGLQFMMAEDATEIECSRLIVQAAAKQYDEKNDDPKLGSMAKLKATETAMQVTTNAVQILGGVGYTKEYPVERFMRDAKGLQIVEGANQIQKVVIARGLKKQYQK